MCNIEDIETIAIQRPVAMLQWWPGVIVALISLVRSLCGARRDLVIGTTIRRAWEGTQWTRLASVVLRTTATTSS